jgi:hypothetical protein
MTSSEFFSKVEEIGFSYSLVVCENTMNPILGFRYEEEYLQFKISIHDFIDLKAGHENKVFYDIISDLLVLSRDVKIKKIVDNGSGF